MPDPTETTRSADVDKALTRQELIWGGLYGPPRAAALVAEARERHGADPSLDIADVIAALEPDDDMDPDEVGTYRPAVG